MNKSLISTVTLLALLASSTTWAVCNSSQQNYKPDSIYTVNGAGTTVTDKETGLMWQQCTRGLSDASCATGTATTITWKAALEVAQTANSNADFGYTDWRLPSITELGTLTNVACYNPAINTTIFPATVNSRYWTSTPNVGSNNSIWVYYFDAGYKSSEGKQNVTNVRLVRGGN